MCKLLNVNKLLSSLLRGTSDSLRPTEAVATMELSAATEVEQEQRPEGAEGTDR